jgi:hypothetical protein
MQNTRTRNANTPIFFSIQEQYSWAIPMTATTLA